MKTTLNIALAIMLFALNICVANDTTERKPSVNVLENLYDAPEVFVLLDLIKRQTDERSKHLYEVYFVQIDAKNSNKIKSLLSGLSPRVEVGTNNAVFTSEGLIDRSSKKPAMLFWAKLKSQSKNAAEITAGYYMGPEGSIGFVYTLKWDGAHWIITQKKRVWVS